MAAPFLLGLAMAAAAQGHAASPSLSLNGHQAIPIGGHWISETEDFPPWAQRAGESGTVTARLFVDGNGRAKGCMILGRPNLPALEARTCSVLLRRARFEPFAAAGLATYDHSIVWDLSRLPPLPQLEIRRVSRHIE